MNLFSLSSIKAKTLQFVKFITICEIFFCKKILYFIHKVMNGDRNINVYFQPFVLELIHWKGIFFDSFVLETCLLLFSLIWSNCCKMKYLKNQQFEEISERSKADPPPTKHKSYWGPFSALKTILYCVDGERDPYVCFFSPFWLFVFEDENRHKKSSFRYLCRFLTFQVKNQK